MIESRLTSVILLDGSQLDFFVTVSLSFKIEFTFFSSDFLFSDFLFKSELITYDLLEMVSAHLCLNDKEYFSLSFMDTT